jgi:WS/DGAT/MGAT family acyltransferase
VTIQRLSGFDTSLLRLETAAEPMTIAVLLELDTSTMPRGYSFSTFREDLLGHIGAVPEFRTMLSDRRTDLGNPLWVQDRNFDVDRHLHRVELPAPGGRHELSELVSRLVAVPLDRTRPLWEMWMIEGLSASAFGTDGRTAVLTKIHHSMLDGSGSRDLFSRLLGTDPDPSPPAPVPDAAPPNRTVIARDGWVRIGRRIRHFFAAVLPASATALVKVIHRTATGRGTTGVLSAPRTPFNGDITASRAVAYTGLSLEDVKAVKNAFGVKVNDVVLAVVSGAIRRYLVDRDALPDEALVAMIPIGVVDESDLSGGNNMSVMFSSLHTHVEDPVQRLLAVAGATARAKAASADIVGTLVRDWAECAPGLIGAVTWLYARSGLSARRPWFNLSLSNVIGALEQSYLLGATVRRIYPLGPVLNGVGLNVSVGTYYGHFDVGLVACADLLPDVWELADGLPVALAELLDAAGELTAKSS